MTLSRPGSPGSRAERLEAVSRNAVAASPCCSQHTHSGLTERPRHEQGPATPGDGSYLRCCWPSCRAAVAAWGDGNWLAGLDGESLAHRLESGWTGLQRVDARRAVWDTLGSDTANHFIRVRPETPSLPLRILPQHHRSLCVCVLRLRERGGRLANAPLGRDQD